MTAMNNKIMSSSSPTRLSCMFILLLPSFFLWFFFFSSTSNLPIPIPCSSFSFFFSSSLLLLLLLACYTCTYPSPSFLHIIINKQLFRIYYYALLPPHTPDTYILYTTHTYIYLHIQPDIQYIITTHTSTPHKDFCCCLCSSSSPGFFPHIYGFLIIDNFPLDA